MTDIDEDSLRKTLTLERLLTVLCRAVVHRELSYKELRYFLECNVQTIHDEGSEKLEQLDGLCWCLLSEIDYGHRTEWSLMEELARALGMPPPPKTWANTVLVYAEYHPTP